MQSRAAWPMRRRGGSLLQENLSPETLKRSAEADVQTSHADAEGAGHFTPGALFEVRLNQQPAVRFGQLHYCAPHQRFLLFVDQKFVGMRSAIGRFDVGAGQRFGCTGLAAGFLGYPIANAAYERAELLRLADALMVHQREYPVEGFIANVFDGVVVSNPVVQPGFQRGRETGNEKPAGVRIALLQSS